MKSGIPYRILSYLYAIGVFIVIGGMIFYEAFQQLQILQTQEVKHRVRVANSIKDRLELAFQYSAASTSTLGYLIEQDDQLTNFDSIASYLIQGNRFIDVIEVLDKGVITHAFPLKGNESAIGYDILADESTRMEAEKAIERRHLFFAGPLQLKQGGMAIVGRQPLFRNDSFIGFTAVVIYLPTLIEVAGIDTSSEASYRIQLGKHDPNTSKKESYLPGGKIDSAYSFTELPIEQGDWILCVQDKSPVTWVRVSLILVFGLIAALLSAFFTLRLVGEPFRLRTLFDKQVAKSYTFQKQRDLILESIGDAFFSIDHHLKITYWNRQAENLLKYSRKQVLGKSMMEIFGDFIDPSLMSTYDPNKKLAEPIHFKQEIKRLDKWFEVSVYPHEFGNAVYFSDITDSIKSTDAIKQRNEKLNEIAQIQSHEVRAPLARLMGIVHVFELSHRQALTDAEKEKLYEEILNAADQLDRTLHDVVEKANKLERDMVEGDS